MGTPYLAQMMVVSFNFAPKGWAQCNGQLLPINQNQALFSLLGTTYGGNGQTNFALPNLQGQCLVGAGQNFSLGSRGGEVNHTLTMSELPAHIHPWNASSQAGTAVTPAGGYLANGSAYQASPPDPAAGVMNPATCSNIGGSQPHSNTSPYLVLNWVIALQGIFPSQN